MTYDDKRVRVAMSGPNREVLLLIAIQPITHLKRDRQPMPVARREAMS